MNTNDKPNLTRTHGNVLADLNVSRNLLIYAPKGFTKAKHCSLIITAHMAVSHGDFYLASDAFVSTVRNIALEIFNSRAGFENFVHQAALSENCRRLWDRETARIPNIYFSSFGGLEGGGS
ncbi:unnamed protein product [Leptosia nina]|uniref:Uncharacterized protein n=1 Tax=Leptosia nina TaxID=320188 RepID=A0AAV1K2V5_9NEOP